MTLSPMKVQAGSQYKVQYLGKFKLTAYCSCKSCSGHWGKDTASGATAKENHTVAVDKRVIPLGTDLKINGETYKAEDVGGGVKGNHIDIFFESHKEVDNFGLKKNQKVYKVVKR